MIRRLSQWVLSCMLVAGVARAEGPAQTRPPLMVLSIEPKGVAANQADAATVAVLRGLRELDVFQVLSAEDLRQLLAIERNRQLYGVEGSGIGDFAQAMGARHAVLGSMLVVGDQLQVELRLVDTAGSKVLAQKTLGPVKAIADVAAQLPALAQEVVAPLLQAQQGALLVRTREEGAEVLVDDQLVASTPMREPVKLSRGQHRLQVRKDGFIAVSQPVRIEPDQTELQDVALLPSADYAEAYALRHGRLRTGAWIATGVALVTFTGAIALDQLATEPLYQQSFLPRQQFLRAQAGLTDSQSKPDAIAQDPRLSQAWDDCASDPVQCRDVTQRMGTQVLVQQIGTAGLAVLGAGAAGVATYLFITGKDPNRYSNVVASFSVGPTPGFVLSGQF